MALEQFAFQALQKQVPGLVKNGLGEQVRKITESADVDQFPRLRFIPDGCRADWECKRLAIYEIEDTCPLTERKLWLIRLFAHELYDETGWALDLYVADRYGTQLRRVWTVDDEITWECDGEVLTESEIQRREQMAAVV